MSMPSWGDQRRPPRGRIFYRDLEDEESLGSKRGDRGQSWHKDGRRKGKFLIMRPMQVIVIYHVKQRNRNFPGQEKWMSAVWVHTLMTSVSLFTICPSSPWSGEWGRISFNNTHFECLRHFFCIYDKTPKYISKWDYQPGLDPRDFG